jgi:hypothetical protein
MSCTRENIRFLATEAKKRLKCGYWTDILSSRRTELEEAKANGMATEGIYSYYRNKVMSDFYRDSLPVSDEDVMYSKVCKILDSEESVTNVIGYLMDKDYYNSADSDERARYVLRLSKLYVRMKERYMLEKRN